MKTNYHKPLLWVFIFTLLAIICALLGAGANLMQIKTYSNLSPYTVGFIVFSEASIAFLVAWIIIQFVERPSQKQAEEDFAKKQQMLSQNIFNYIHGVQTPRVLYDFVENNLLKAKFFRRNLDVTYNFLEGMDGLWLIQAEVWYDVHNLTGQPQTYELRGGIEKPHKKKQGFGQRLGLTSLCVDDLEIPEAELLSAQDDIEDTEDYFTINHEVEIPANSKRNIKMQVLMEKLAKDSEFFRTLDCTDGITLTVNHPEGLDVRLAAIHPKREFNFRTPVDNRRMKRVVLNEPFLPQNGAMFWWGEERTPSDTATETTDEPVIAAANESEVPQAGQVSAVTGE